MGGFLSKSPAPKPFDLKTDAVSLKGKVAIVTGAKGIGLATVRHLLRYTNAKVYLASRDASSAEAAIAQLHSEGLGGGGDHSLGEVVWLKLDLSDPRDAKKAAEEFLQREERLDLLINNAGMMGVPGTSDGVSNMHIVNYISPYVFTRTLLPLLKKTALEENSDVRIVNVASEVHGFIPSGANFKDVQDFNIPYKYYWPLSNFFRYGNAKLAYILWSRNLQSQLNSEGFNIPVLSLHPGPVNTMWHNFPFPHFTKWLFGLFMMDPSDGALTTLFCATSKTVRDNRDLYTGRTTGTGGVFLVHTPVPGTITQPSVTARDDKRGVDVVATTEKFLKQIGV